MEERKPLEQLLRMENKYSSGFWEWGIEPPLALLEDRGKVAHVHS